jgi:hypothetical protein
MRADPLTPNTIRNRAVFTVYYRRFAAKGLSAAGRHSETMAKFSAVGDDNGSGCTR